MFKQVKKFNAEEEEARLAQEAENASKPSDQVARKPRPVLQMGANAFMLMPSTDKKNSTPYAHALIHYNPFHVCGRRAPIENPTEDGLKFIEDNFFSNCARCDKAWEDWMNTTPKSDWDEMKETKRGKSKFFDQGAGKDRFKSEMSNHQGIVQVVSLSPFFKVASTGTSVSLDTKLFKEWIEPYCDLVRAASQTDELVEPPEGMPEDMAKHAQAGVGILLVNKQTILAIREAYLETEEAEEEDPVFLQEKFLFQIVRTKDDKTFQAGGQTRYSTTTKVKFKKVKGYTLPESLLELANEMITEGTMQNIHDLGNYGPDVELQLKAASLANLSDDEMLEYLSLYGPKDESEHLEEEVEEVETTSRGTSPDDYQESELFSTGGDFDDLDDEDEDIPF